MRLGPPNVASAALIHTSGRPGVAYQTESGTGTVSRKKDSGMRRCSTGKDAVAEYDGAVVLTRISIARRKRTALS